MASLSFLTVGIPASSRLVYRPVFPQIVVTPPASTGFGGGGGTRYWSNYDSLGGRKKRRIDELIAAEERVVEALQSAEDRGADIAILERLLAKLKKLQAMLAALARESEAARRYIDGHQDNEILFIMSAFDL